MNLEKKEKFMCSNLSKKTTLSGDNQNLDSCYQMYLTNAETFFNALPIRNSSVPRLSINRLENGLYGISIQNDAYEINLLRDILSQMSIRDQFLFHLGYYQYRFKQILSWPLTRFLLGVGTVLVLKFYHTALYMATWALLTPIVEVLSNHVIKSGVYTELLNGLSHVFGLQTAKEIQRQIPEAELAKLQTKMNRQKFRNFASSIAYSIFMHYLLRNLPGGRVSVPSGPITIQNGEGGNIGIWHAGE